MAAVATSGVVSPGEAHLSLDLGRLRGQYSELRSRFSQLEELKARVREEDGGSIAAPPLGTIDCDARASHDGLPTHLLTAALGTSSVVAEDSANTSEILRSLCAKVSEQSKEITALRAEIVHRDVRSDCEASGHVPESGFQAQMIASVASSADRTCEPPLPSSPPPRGASAGPVCELVAQAPIAQDDLNGRSLALEPAGKSSPSNGVGGGRAKASVMPKASTRKSTSPLRKNTGSVPSRVAAGSGGASSSKARPSLRDSTEQGSQPPRSLRGEQIKPVSVPAEPTVSGTPPRPRPSSNSLSATPPRIAQTRDTLLAAMPTSMVLEDASPCTGNLGCYDGDGKVSEDTSCGSTAVKVDDVPTAVNSPESAAHSDMCDPQSPLLSSCTLPQLKTSELAARQDRDRCAAAALTQMLAASQEMEALAMFTHPGSVMFDLEFAGESEACSPAVAAQARDLHALSLSVDNGVGVICRSADVVLEPCAADPRGFNSRTFPQWSSSLGRLGGVASQNEAAADAIRRTADQLSVALSQPLDLKKVADCSVAQRQFSPSRTVTPIRHPVSCNSFGVLPSESAVAIQHRVIPPSTHCRILSEATVATQPRVIPPRHLWGGLASSVVGQPCEQRSRRRSSTPRRTPPQPTFPPASSVGCFPTPPRTPNGVHSRPWAADVPVTMEAVEAAVARARSSVGSLNVPPGAPIPIGGSLRTSIGAPTVPTVSSSADWAAVVAAGGCTGPPSRCSLGSLASHGHVSPGPPPLVFLGGIAPHTGIAMQHHVSPPPVISRSLSPPVGVDIRGGGRVTRQTLQAIRSASAFDKAMQGYASPGPRRPASLVAPSQSSADIGNGVRHPGHASPPALHMNIPRSVTPTGRQAGGQPEVQGMLSPQVSLGAAPSLSTQRNSTPSKRQVIQSDLTCHSVHGHVSPTVPSAPPKSQRAISPIGRQARSPLLQALLAPVAVGMPPAQISSWQTPSTLNRPVGTPKTPVCAVSSVCLPMSHMPSRSEAGKASATPPVPAGFVAAPVQSWHNVFRRFA